MIPFKSIRLSIASIASVISIFLPALATADLQAGGARVDITPDVAAMAVPLGGYAARKSMPATGVHDAVYARALAFSDGKTEICIVSTDLCFIPASLKSDVIKIVNSSSASKKLDADHIFIAATHSHTSPDPLAMHSLNVSQMKGWTTYSQPLDAFTAERIAHAITLADSRLMPVQVGAAALDCTGLNRNRRNEKVTDPTMTVLRINDMQGRALGCIVNFAAHPTLYDDKMMQISADWPGAMCADLERKMGGDSVALFLNGAEGDASPAGATGATPSERVTMYGTSLADRAWDILRILQVKPDVQIRSWRQELVLPERKPNALFIIAARSFGATMAQARQIVNQLMPEKSTVGYVTIGDLLLVTTPCEPSGEIGLAIKSSALKAGYNRVGVMALTDDWLAYALTSGQYREGNYEAGMSFYGDQLGPTILSAIEKGLTSK